MIKATRQDKHLVIDILSKAFNNNQSVNYIVQQDQSRQRRIRSLMKYSFELCYQFGDVFLSNDKKACALIIYPDKKKVTLKTLLLDLQLILTAVGSRNIRKAMARESMISSIHPKGLKAYLWFIGVHPNHQQQGIGSTLLTKIIKHSKQESRPVYLETSTLMNLPWYQNFGFTKYH